MRGFPRKSHVDTGSAFDVAGISVLRRTLVDYSLTTILPNLGLEEADWRSP